MTETAERTLVRLRPHKRALLLPVVILWLVAFLAPFLLNRLDWELWNVTVLSVAVVLVALLCLMPTLAWLTRWYVLTDRRVIVRGAWGGTRREVRYDLIHDVAVRKRVAQSIFGSGDVLITTMVGDRVVLSDVPQVSLVQRCLNEQLDT